MTHLALRAALCALALTLAVAAPAAAQSDPIEAVWEFSGGQIAVERQSDGTFVGIVVRPTQLSECTHQNGEPVWIDIRSQPDGQYFGRHQYFRTSDCSFIERGMIALRVLQNEQGATFLRVCFDSPERSPNEQPSIAPDGTNTSTDDGCRDSNQISPLPTTPPKLADVVSGLPPQTRGCASRRKFPIRLKEPVGDAIAATPKPKVTRNGKSIPVTFTGGRWRSVIDLRGLPKGRYTFKIVAKTVRGRTIQGSRKYKTCGKVRRIGNVGPI
ncbi:MAG TPA: hypothetical protein VF587_12040 [Solirubrobacteraceae bacterium]